MVTKSREVFGNSFFPPPTVFSLQFHFCFILWPFNFNKERKQPSPTVASTISSTTSSPSMLAPVTCCTRQEDLRPFHHLPRSLVSTFSSLSGHSSQRCGNHFLQHSILSAQASLGAQHQPLASCWRQVDPCPRRAHLFSQLVYSCAVPCTATFCRLVQTTSPPEMLQIFHIHYLWKEILLLNCEYGTK